MTSGGRRWSGCCSACSEQAAEAWRAHVGDADSTVRRRRPGRPPLPGQLDTDEMSVRGDEPRRVMDNWFRADARIRGLARTLRSQGRPLPAAPPSTTTSTSRCSPSRSPTGTSPPRRPPDPEVVDALAGNGWRGAAGDLVLGLPGPGPLPARADRRLDPDPVTLGVITLLPEWVRWLGERAGLFGRGCPGRGGAGVEATSVSTTTRLTRGRRAGRRRGRRGTPRTPRRTRTGRRLRPGRPPK